MKKIKEKKYNYLYKITNSINDYIYIGMHSTDNLEDEYFGGGTELRKAIKKLGIKNFTLETLEFFENRRDLARSESELINKNFLNKVNVYNRQSGAHILSEEEELEQELENERIIAEWLVMVDKLWGEESDKILLAKKDKHRRKKINEKLKETNDDDLSYIDVLFGKTES